jgi:hypothetical protein
LLRTDGAGPTLFYPDGDEGKSYLIPDADTEQRIFLQLKRIRSAQLAAWLLLPIAVIGSLVATDGRLPDWLFLLVLVGAVLVIQFAPERARQSLAHGLNLASAPQPSLLDKFPFWATVAVVALIVGLAVYFRETWPVMVLTWATELGPYVTESKVLAKAAVIIGGAAAILWGIVAAIRKRL